MWPIQLAFRLLISCRIFLFSLTLSNTSPCLTTQYKNRQFEMNRTQYRQRDKQKLASCFPLKRKEEWHSVTTSPLRCIISVACDILFIYIACIFIAYYLLLVSTNAHTHTHTHTHIYIYIYLNITLYYKRSYMFRCLCTIFRELWYCVC